MLNMIMLNEILQRWKEERFKIKWREFYVLFQFNILIQP